MIALLENLKGIVDEVLVIDSCSEDATAVIARAYGAKVVFVRTFGYVEPLRMYGVSRASYPWVLWLDADERLSSTLRRDLKSYLLMAERNGCSAMSVRIISCKGERRLLFSPSQPRIVRKDCTTFKGIMHEMPSIKGSILEPVDDRISISRQIRRSVQKSKERLGIRMWQFTPSLELITPIVVPKTCLLYTSDAADE